MAICFQNTVASSGFVNSVGVLVTDLGKDYVQCISLAYWAIVLSVIPFILVITLAVRAHLVK